MSVGGTIVDIVVVAPDKVWVDTADRSTRWVGAGMARQTVAIYCDPEGHVLEVGDRLWWQGKVCYWTSSKQHAKLKDVPLKKLSYSGVPHPDLMNKITKT